MITRKIYTIIVLFSLNLFCEAQSKNSSSRSIAPEQENKIADTVQLPELTIGRVGMSEDEKKKFLLLKKRVFVVYIYAKMAADKYLALKKGMAGLKSNKEKKQYFKLVEKYLTVEFEDQLKKLSTKQGQILIKLLNRQTGITTYELIKELKSGFKSFASNVVAGMYDLDLKDKYNPYNRKEDFLIESILVNAFENHKLPYQDIPNPIDYDKLKEHWYQKSKK